MAAEDSDGIDDAPLVDPALVRLAKTEQSDPVAELLRANIRRTLLGVDEPPRIGRFTVLHKIGHGAMGTVLAAYDPTLDRKVALKVVRDPGTAKKAELLREARTLARLTHPHVVTVFEAEEIDGGVVIAMQLVQGPDLRGWLRERPRSWPELQPVFAAIADGLAAAHRADVVHGDLKPENVLVGDDGVRIADFGTARVLADSSDPSHGGTLEYMAPERLAGAPASVAADQFAFAVTMCEALFGKRPSAATSNDPGRSDQTGARVPRRIVALLERGLATDPTRRWPGMAEIATEIERKDRTAPWVLGLAAATMIFGATWFAARNDRDACAAGEQTAQTLWSAADGEKVRTAFARGGGAHAESVAARVDELLARRRDQWAAAHREVCEATRVRAQQSDSLHDLRMRCLDRRAHEQRALVDALVDPDHAPAIDDAITAVADLPDLERCDAASVQATQYAVPETEAEQDAVAQSRADIDRAWALFGLGRYQEALAHAQQIARDADASAFEPLQVEALLLLGAAHGRISAPGLAEPTFRRARRIAAQLGNDRIAADIMIRWLRTVMFAGDAARTEDLAEHARVAALRAGTSMAEIDAIVGEARLHAGDPQGALEVLEAALAAQTRVDHRAMVTVNLGSARLALGDPTAALADYEQALALATEHFGPSHPALEFYMHRVGRGFRAMGRVDEAMTTLERVLSLRQASLGADDRAIATILADLAAAEQDAGRLDDAAAHLLRAIEIRNQELGPEHARVADLVTALGDIERARGRTTTALTHYRRAAQIRAATPAHPQLAAIRAQITALEAELD